MALSPTQIARLKEIARTRKVPIAEYLTVYWDENDPSETRHYAISKYNEQVPFGGIGLDIEPCLLDSPFDGMEINPDLRTQELQLNFNDIDKAITARFKQFDSGVACEIFQYFPDVNEHEPIWNGQLQAPQVWGWKTLRTVATNGGRSREQKVPGRGKEPDFCGFKHFGGSLPTLEAVTTNGCIYDKHLGGSVGNFKTGSTPFVDCARDPASCAARGMSIYIGTFPVDGSAVVTDGNSGYAAISKGNNSDLDKPLPKLYGSKTVRESRPIQWRRELNASNQDRGFVAGIWPWVEGPVRSMRNFKIGEKLIEQEHQSHRLGNNGQSALTGYSPNLSRYSSTAHSFGRKGWVNPLDENPETMTAEIFIEGATDVPVYQTTTGGPGVLANFYGDTIFGNLAATRIDQTINYPTSSIMPVQGIDSAAGFSIEWSGTITFLYSQTYTFTLEHDDSGLLVINGSTIINQSLFGTHTGVFAATAGVPYTFSLKVVQNASVVAFNPWAAVLKWQSTSQAFGIVPATAFANTGATGFVRQWTNNRLWCLLDAMTHNKAGMSYPLSRFNTEVWAEVASWSYQPVRFSLITDDGETKNFDHTRTQFDCKVDGLPVAELLNNICRSGRISIPFQHKGLYEVAAVGRPFTQAELDAAPVFYDKGENMNIFWENGEPAISLTQTPNNQIPNKIRVIFEDGSNSDISRTITARNRNQQALAGRTLGQQMLMEVATDITGYGIRSLNEAVKLAHSIDRFGEYNKGGSLNNGTIVITVPRIWSLDVKRYMPIRVVSELLSSVNAPKLPNGDDMEWFQVQQIVKVNKDFVQIVGQVYNHEAVVAFEELRSATVPAPGDPEPFPPFDPSPDPLPDPDDPMPIPPLEQLTIDSATASNGYIEISIS